MPTMKENPYTSWEFKDSEIRASRVFTDLNYKHIQNELAAAATEKALLAFTPDNPVRFQHENEYIRGKMEAYTLLLRLHDDEISAMKRECDNEPDLL